MVCVWLPDWPVTVWRRAPRPPNPAAADAPPDPAQPLALVERGAHGLRLLALNPAARRLGLSAGQAHADATAMVPHLVSVPAQPREDAAALRRLALWAERFSPLVALLADRPGDEALWIDMTGGAHLFGGEAALLADIRRRLSAAGIPARLALADTPAAAWALARYGAQAQPIAAAGETRQALADLPVEGLRLEPAALSLLRRFGLRRIGDLYALPRAGLARRFRGEAGLRVVERLDKALGVLTDPLIPQRPAPLYRSWRVFAEPLIDVEGIAAQIPDLAQALGTQLDGAGLGARRLSLTAFRVDGRVSAIAAGLSAPAAAPGHMLRLLRETGLERLDLGFGADALMLSADTAEPIRTRQIEMGDTREAAGAQALAGLIDRLGARLGEDAIRIPQARESWLPERSEAWLRAGSTILLDSSDVILSRREAASRRPHAAAALRPSTRALASAAQDDGQGWMGPRPILLLDPPEPVEAIAQAPDGPPARFVWRRAPRRVIKAEGPERIGAEWWRVDAGPKIPRTRDYYRIEDDQGRRYWLFREGLYGREDAERAPDWWLHGVFA
jgi:protein ImuB